MTAKTVILAAGDFPRRGGEAFRLLAAAAHVVACDSAARGYRRRFHRWPEVVVGDFDSFGSTKALEAETRVVRETEQETNDLAKAIRFCRREGWEALVVVGATGRREDHALGNIFLALDEGLTVVTDHGAFHPVSSTASFRAPKGSAVSIFAPKPGTRLTSKGLKWPLDGVKMGSLYAAILNRTTAETFSLTTTHPVSVFIAKC